ncbi:hypothetical protein PHYSODRAFT_471613 [Phytophthora sojae]|uniref:Uncharacterized protein n=1 Tax=Phytophthora sojae (strain P6497) TaxID=1094619 RepID=G4YJP6_PHYSP|nr:hypothetical protein PHYSODRAFT_471613 [Phytophthora sojae]EGZ30158.1 hypothetical protein PHYSODRAFT_471613 [Phytophthora sojae]|eukprot:XP_009517433.1 hypothetical protein PHYSODRAFT_471613 [Phytophthora sojae]
MKLSVLPVPARSSPQIVWLKQSSVPLPPRGQTLQLSELTALFAAGVDRLTIKLFGRWSSDAFERYTRMNEATTRSLAEQMEEGPGHVSAQLHWLGLRPATTRSSTS